MDTRGFNRINEALGQAEVQAIVTPEPQGDEHVEHLTIDSDPTVAPARILNALGSVGLLAQTPGQTAVLNERYPYQDAVPNNDEGPKLEVLFGQPGSITFVDVNNGY